MGSDPLDRSSGALPRPLTPPDWRDRVDEWGDRLVDLTEGHRLWRVAVGVLALCGAALAAWVLLAPGRAGPPIEASLPLFEPVVGVASPVPVETTISVHVAGAVERPGLVELQLGARVADAVAGAGGAITGADPDRINLAQPLADADRIYVPLIDEVVAAELGGSELGAEAEGPLDLNRANAFELDDLPGIGPATAAAIVRYREDNGDFTSISELESVAGIGPAKLEQLRDLVAVR
jgi:competence protein ComEA